MRQDQSFGIIPLRYIDGVWELFLVKHRKGHWAFPKGHAAAEETPKEAAIRECVEETGMKPVSFLDERPLEEHYQYSLEGETVDKSVSYFLVIVQGEPQLQIEEIVDGGWFSFEKAQNRLTFDEAKKLLEQTQYRLYRSNPNHESKFG